MDKTIRFGIEIETVAAGKQALARAIHSVVGGYITGANVQAADGRTWSVVHDGSLSGVDNGEVVSPILSYDDLPVLQDVVRALRHAGARSDASCGIHIHVDGSRLGGKAISNLVKMVAKQERILEHALGITDQRLGRYCRPINDDLVAEIESRRPLDAAAVSRLWYGTHGGRPTRYDGSRYHGLNLNSLFFRGTVEFRWFQMATEVLHAGEVKAYVQFVLALVTGAMKRRGSSAKRRTYSAQSAKYDFRVFLLGLGLIGDEFETARLHLLKRLPGSAAWKNGRPTRPAALRGAESTVPRSNASAEPPADSAPTASPPGDPEPTRLP